MSEQDRQQSRTESTETAATGGSTAADDVFDDLRKRGEGEVRPIDKDREDRDRDAQDDMTDRPAAEERVERTERVDDRDAPRDDSEGDRDSDDTERADVTPDEPTTADDAPRMSDSSDDEDADAAKGDEDPRSAESDEDKQRREEEFAAEHDPADHDISAGEEFRQKGDWTAEEAGGEQKWDAEGNLVEGTHPGDPSSSGDEDGSQGGDTSSGSGDSDDGGRSTDGRRVSSLDEIRDGGYGVGSAAPIDDGAMPLDHSIKAWEDTKTYLCSGEDGYDGAEPHVWFLDGRAAEAAGFRHAD